MAVKEKTCISDSQVGFLFVLTLGCCVLHMPSEVSLKTLSIKTKMLRFLKRTNYFIPSFTEEGLRHMCCTDLSTVQDWAVPSVFYDFLTWMSVLCLW
jgi:hypothetical protein